MLQYYKKLKYYLLLFFIFLLLLIATWFFWYEPLYTPTAVQVPHAQLHLPRFIAHKSLLSTTSIGNTLSAIESVLLSPVEGIEVDVRLSKDKVPFLFHDDRLENLTNLTGIPEEKTWNELKEGFYKGHKTPFDRIIKLEDVFKKVDSDKFLFLDIKNTDIFNQTFSKVLSDLIEKYQLEETVIVESFNPFFLTQMRLVNRYIQVMYDFTDDSKALGEENQKQFDQIPWILKQEWFRRFVRKVVQPDYLGPRWTVDKNLVTKLIKQGYPLFSWTVDDVQEALQLLNLGVRGIQTNKPLELIHKLEKSFAVKVQDAGGEKATVKQQIYVTREKQIVEAILYAQENKKKISIGGRKHTMGGHTMFDKSIHIDMLGYNSLTYEPQTTYLTVQAGATWKKIQKFLDKHKRSVKIMQSDNIFTVGGSLSANVHGWQTHSPPIASTVVNMKVALADGKIVNASLTENKELFSLVLGGYGQFGVILEATLETMPNVSLNKKCDYFSYENYDTRYHKLVSVKKEVELAYGRLSLDSKNFLRQASLCTYQKSTQQDLEPMSREKFVSLKRSIFRTSEFSDYGKKLRWFAEKNLSSSLEESVFTRNTVMSPDIHLLWPVRQDRKDILQEYFIPKGKVASFLDNLRYLSEKHNMDLLNVTIREIKKDNISYLPFAKFDGFGFVLLFSHPYGKSHEEKMKTFTNALVEKSLELEGTFYLPYRPHYSRKQLLKAYPEINQWIEKKDKFDPRGIFYSNYYAFLLTLLKKAQ